MDIMMPGIDEPSAAAPSLILCTPTDVPRLIGGILTKNPQASMD